MSDESGWKVFQPKNQHNSKWTQNGRNKKGGKGSQSFLTNATDLFTEIDQEREQFHDLSEQDRDTQAKGLWALVHKAIIKLVLSSDFVNLITPIYKSIWTTTDNKDHDDPKSIINTILFQFHPNPQHILSPKADSSCQDPCINFRSIILSIIIDTFQTVQSSSDTHPTEPDLPALGTLTDAKILQRFTHSSFGIGSISKHQSSLLQFAYYLIIIALFPAEIDIIDKKTAQETPQIETQPLIYDPMFTPLDLYLFDTLGLKTIPNTEGRLPNPHSLIQSTPTAINKHICFVPHCPNGISHNILLSFWNETQLPHLILLSNSFDQIMTNTLIPNRFYELRRYLPTLGCEKPTGKGKRNKKVSVMESDPISIPIASLNALYPDLITDPHFFFGLDQYYAYMNQYGDQLKEKNSLPTPPPPPPPPSLALLLVKPWLIESKLSYPSQNNLVNDMSVHSFHFTQKENEKIARKENEKTPSEATSNALPTLFSFCPIIPTYTPSVSTNPELIPISLRPQ